MVKKVFVASLTRVFSCFDSNCSACGGVVVDLFSNELIVLQSTFVNNSALSDQVCTVLYNFQVTIKRGTFKRVFLTFYHINSYCFGE